MSFDTFVVCREPLPARDGGWTLTVGRVRISEVKAADHPDVVAHAGFAAAQLLVLNYPALSGEVGDDMARMLAEVSRGTVVYEDGADDREDFEPSAHRTLTAQVLEADLAALWKDAQVREQRAYEQTKREFDTQAKKDPEVFARANDWSDL